MTKSRIQAIFAIAAASALLGQFPSLARADEIWVGGDGATPTSWNDANNWSGSAVPGTTDSIYIGESATTYTNVNYNVGSATTLTTSGALMVSAGYTLSASAAGGALGLDGGYASAVATTITSAATGLSNLGTIDFAGGAGAYWSIGMGGRGGTGQGSAISTNDGLIEVTGAGAFGISGESNTGGLVNGGTIMTAPGSGGTLAFATITGYSSGAYTVGGVGIKIIGGSVINSAGCTITNGNEINSQAYLQDVQLSNSGTLVAGNNTASLGATTYNYAGLYDYSGTTFTNSGTAAFTERTYSGDFENASMAIGYASFSAYRPGYSSSADTASVLNNPGATISFTGNGGGTGGGTVSTGMDINTTGSITNDGTISFTDSPTLAGATNTSVYLAIGRSATIATTPGDSGAITFSDHPNQYVEAMISVPTAPTLTLSAGQTLSGAVNLGNGQIGIVNDGTIRATGVNPIAISTAGGNSFTNNGTLAVNDHSTIDDTDTSLAFSNGSTFSVLIDSDDLSTGQLDVSGGLDLGNGVASLSVSDLGSTVLTAGTVFTLIDPNSTSGYFNGLTSGTIFTVGDNNYQISYTGGSGDDVTLTSVSVVPEPAIAALLALGGLGLLKRRRRPRPIA